MLDNMKAIYLITLFFLSFDITCYSQISQSTNAVALPSVNNNFLGRSGQSGEAVDVDLYTGAATVNIPICVLPGKQMNIPIFLNYTGGKGVKLQDYASQAGLGWQFNAGGNVSRVVRGFPDENSNGYIVGGWGTILNNVSGNVSALTGSQQSSLGVSGSAPTVDGEPDLFSVNTPFFSFQFTFDGNGNPVFSNNTGIRIQFLNHTSFIVTDDQGNQYFFGSSPSSIETTTTLIYGNSYTFPTTWYLDKIVAYNSSETINLTYFTYGSPDNNYHYVTTYAYDNSVSASSTDNTPVLFTINSPKYINTMTSSQGEIWFNYQGDRQDDPQAARLTGMTVKGFNPITQTALNALTNYSFNYSYFGSPSTDPNVLRLCLSNITISGSTIDSENPLTLYSFSYNTANTMPSRQSQTFDFWGYATIFSPTTANPMLTPSVRQPNLGMTMTDVLTGISDIQGETWNIAYEQNTYYNAGNIPVGGLRVTQLSKTWNGNTLSTQYSYNDNNGHSTGQIYNTINPSSQVNNAAYNNLSYIMSSVSGIGLNYSESPYLTYDLVGNFVGYSSVKVVNPNQSYTISQFSNYNTTNSQDYTATTGSVITVASSKAYKRGLLLEKTLYTSANNPVSDDIYSYTSLTSPQTTNSWGYHWLTIGLTLNYCTQYIFGTCIGPASESILDNAFSTPYATFIENYRLTSIAHKDYDQLNPANSVATTTTMTYDLTSDPANTKRLLNTVTTTDSKGINDVKTLYHAADVANTGATAIPMLTTTETNAINTLLVGNRAGTVIHTTDNRNNTINQLHNSYTTAVNNNIYLASTAAYTSDPVNTTNTLVKQEKLTYDPLTSNLISSSETGGAPTAMLYGYNASLPVAEVVNASSSNTPTVTNSSSAVTLSNGTNNATQTIPFTVAANGTITVSLSWPSLPAEGTSNFATVSFGVTGPPGFSPLVGASICISSDHFCSAYGNTVSVPFNVIAGNYVLTITNTQNPQNNFTLFQVTWPATIANSFSNQFFYEGFEQIGTVSNIVHTGTQCYAGPYTVPFVIPDSRSYLLQYWTYTGAAWTFTQQPYTGPVTLTGTIDDVRVFPKDALMTTYTYNSSVGKTSEIDPSGRTIVYQYDGLNRLNTLRDQDNNILKQYDYEYQSCVVQAYNTAQSAIFTKNNCGTGLYGLTATYAVPANRYSACTIAAANQLATNDLNLNGQNYANANAGCTATPPCIAPTTVTASASSSTVTVTWNYPAGVGTNAYAVFIKNAATGATAFNTYGASSPLSTSSGLAFNTNYIVTVMSLCGSDPVSIPVNVTTGGAASQAVNLTNLATSPSGFCCHGCQYTTGVYASTATIGPGTTLFTDAAMTHPLSGMTWIMPYNGNPGSTVFGISGNTVQTTTSPCH
jgi:YD repeat-containing protein